MIHDKFNLRVKIAMEMFLANDITFEFQSSSRRQSNTGMDNDVRVMRMIVSVQNISKH